MGGGQGRIEEMEQVGEAVLAVLVGGSADGGRKLMDGYEQDFKCSEGEKKGQERIKPRNLWPVVKLAQLKRNNRNPRKPPRSALIMRQATPLPPPPPPPPPPHPSPTHRLFQKSTQTLRGLRRSIEVGIAVGAAFGGSEISEPPPAVTAPSLC